MQVRAQMSSMAEDTEMDGRGCSQIASLGCQHPRQQVSAGGLQVDPRLGLWNVVCLLSVTLCYTQSILLHHGTFCSR